MCSVVTFKEKEKENIFNIPFQKTCKRLNKFLVRDLVNLNSVQIHVHSSRKPLTFLLIHILFKPFSAVLTNTEAWISWYCTQNFLFFGTFLHASQK